MPSQNYWHGCHTAAARYRNDDGNYIRIADPGLDREAQMVSDMLFLARTDNGQYQLSRVDVDLAKEVQSFFDDYETWVEERGVALALHGNVTIPADQLSYDVYWVIFCPTPFRHTPSGNTGHVQCEQLPG